RSTIDTDLLFHISRILDHDFFRDISAELSQFVTDNLDQKRVVYDEIMRSVAQSLNRKLSELSLSEKELVVNDK
ncbi:MAG: hypothetical protein K2K97_06795, partial [Muribaculaceae bacterium]|nr:hypothetical protein [Muribaculaceae bacterium]